MKEATNHQVGIVAWSADTSYKLHAIVAEWKLCMTQYHGLLLTKVYLLLINIQTSRSSSQH